MAEVVTYNRTGERCYCQIRFDSGEQALLSIAGKPTPSVKLFKMMGGVIPVKTVWEFTLQMAGRDLDNYLRHTLFMFVESTDDEDLMKMQGVHPLDSFRDLLLQARSLAEARQFLLDAQARAEYIEEHGSLT